MNVDPGSSAGGKLRSAMKDEKPLQVAGVVSAYAALLAEKAGFRALYLSGAGVANSAFGLPDLGMTTLTEVVEETRRITAATDLPLLVDADTGFGAAFSIERTVYQLTMAGAAGMHIEDQVQTKRCGHRPGKALIEAEEMADRVRAATAAKIDPEFVVMARTDAYSVEGLEAAIERARLYEEAGAEMIFAEALSHLEDYKEFTDEVSVPVLANITEFGATPLFAIDELAEVGVSLALYPLSAFRAMSAAALKVYKTLREDGTQKNALGNMQTREELYDVLRYHEYEDRLDRLFAKDKE